MTTFNLELTGRYVAARGDRPDLEARRVARAVFVRDTVRALYNADKKFGIDPAEEHLEHIANDVSQRSVVAPLTRGGDTA